MGLIGNESVYELANYYLKKKDYENARKYLYLELQDEKYAKYALDKLVSLDIKEGNYAHARELLQTYAKENAGMFSCGLLESAECNYEASKSYYEKCLDSVVQDKSRLAIARLEVQLGEYEIAREMLERLRAEGKYLNQAPIEFIYLNIIRKNYAVAYDILVTMDKSTLTANQLRNCNQLNVYLLYLMKRMDTLSIPSEWTNDYLICRLLDSSNRTLKKHMNKHRNPKYKESIGYFLEGKNLDGLLEEIKKHISVMNPNHFNLID